MKVFVTGGAGFIGQSVVRSLLDQGHQVTVFDNLVTGFQDAVTAPAKLVIGDLRDADKLGRAVRGHDAVIHLAAQALVTNSIENPRFTFDNNVVGGFNLLEAMRTEGIGRLVHSSSCAVYGIPQRLPITETAPTAPVSPYGATKLAAENLLHAYHASYGLDVVNFRYFNPFGPGERHQPETHVVPNIIRSILDRQPVLLYWNGEQKRDFCYVADLAAAHVVGLQQTGYHTYNLGSGQAVTVMEIVRLVERLTKLTATISDQGERLGDPPELRADISKVKRKLQWSPRTSLDQAIRRTIEYFQSAR